ncbi:pheromone-processing carboxypeptidase KEX1-like [Eutrema salsugineum]|uniref:pheromone-processing carboxypeptidase KEX1-like n=1 Tax=Eutrema salsugineum TaxID=72664 RepID=UPI000CED0FF0|nr:pheromone-processing carboxypeptidase KEX1-like [Eutrema salsugineum]
MGTHNAKISCDILLDSSSIADNNDTSKIPCGLRKRSGPRELGSKVFGFGILYSESAHGDRTDVQSGPDNEFEHDMISDSANRSIGVCNDHEQNGPTGADPDESNYKKDDPTNGDRTDDIGDGDIVTDNKGDGNDGDDSGSDQPDTDNNDDDDDWYDGCDDEEEDEDSDDNDGDEYDDEEDDEDSTDSDDSDGIDEEDEDEESDDCEETDEENEDDDYDETNELLMVVMKK